VRQLSKRRIRRNRGSGVHLSTDLRGLRVDLCRGNCSQFWPMSGVLLPWRDDGTVEKGVEGRPPEVAPARLHFPRLDEWGIKSAVVGV
jgi:hypothetical protein